LLLAIAGKTVAAARWLAYRGAGIGADDVAIVAAFTILNDTIATAGITAFG
jgi:hypothetical protein